MPKPKMKLRLTVSLHEQDLQAIATKTQFDRWRWKAVTKKEARKFLGDLLSTHLCHYFAEAEGTEESRCHLR